MLLSGITSLFYWGIGIILFFTGVIFLLMRLIKKNKKYQLIKNKLLTYKNSIIFHFLFVVLLISGAKLLLLHNYFWLVISLISIGLLISLIPLFKIYWSKDEYKSIIRFLNIIIGTLAGVFMAIHFNQLETDREKREEVGKILQATKGNIYACERVVLPIIANTTDTNGKNSYKSVNSYDKMLPISLTEILKMDIVLECVTQTTIERLSVSSSKVTTLYEYLYDSNKDYNFFKKISNEYYHYLGVSFQLLEYERMYLLNQISEDSLKTLDSLLMPEYEFEKSIPSIAIEFDIPKASFVELTVYNTLGKEILVPVNKQLKAGKHKVVLNGLNVPSGMYFSKLITADSTVTRKMVLLK